MTRSDSDDVFVWIAGGVALGLLASIVLALVVLDRRLAVIGRSLDRNHPTVVVRIARCSHGVSSYGPVRVRDGKVVGRPKPTTEACLP